MKVIKHICNTVKCLGFLGALKYRVALELKKHGIPLFKKSEWSFNARKKGFRFIIRPYEADIYLIRELILGSLMDGIGEYDVKSMERIFSEGNGDNLNVIDAGANIGLFSLIMAAKYPNAEIVAVEPDIANFKILSKNCKNFDNIHCLNSGIWGADCNLKLVNPGCGAMSYRFEETDGVDGGVQAKCIETIMREFEFQKIDILKMDIEGSEKEVFENSNFWRRKVTYYLIETHDRYTPGCTKCIDDLLKGDGYKYDKHGENHIYYNV